MWREESLSCEREMVLDGIVVGNAWRRLSLAGHHSESYVGTPTTKPALTAAGAS
jgi:hypothetical protein